jgi:hypothetical protein
MRGDERSRPLLFITLEDRDMVPALLALTVVLTAGGVVAAPTTTPTPSDFLRHAILDGLAEDGVPPALAAALAKNPDFVGKCPICSPTHDALAEYGKLAIAPAAKKGMGLRDELVKRLKSEKTEIRHSALRELIQRYVERGYVRLKLIGEQRTALHNQLEEMRKRAMGGLRQGQKYCPSCDGAACRMLKL